MRCCCWCYVVDLVHVSSPAANINELLQTAERQMVEAKKIERKVTPGLTLCEIASREWQEQCLESKDERTFVFTVHVHQAYHLHSNATTSQINAYCVVSVLDDRTEAVLQRAKTPIVRDTTNPIWEDIFHFGKDRYEQCIPNK